MPLVVPNSAEVRMLANILNKTPPENLVLKLYANDVSPAEASVIGDFTEVAGGGYVAVNLTPANWAITSGAPSEAAYPEITFSFTGAVAAVYGYYVVEQTSGQLKWAERFSGAVPFAFASGDQLKVTPKLTLE